MTRARTHGMIYLDHAATSWPKPPCVAEAITAALDRAGGNPGRSGHPLAMAAAEEIYTARETLACLFGITDPLRLIFTSGATAALNLAIKGTLHPGDHVVFSAMEHNAVWRPLKKLETYGIRLSMAAAQTDGRITPQAIEAAIEPDTKLVVLTHASNVNGALNDIAGAAEVAHHHGALLLADAAQTAGVIPIDVQAMQIDMLAFAGHKGLHGPQGTGGLYIREGLLPDTLTEGGTGSASASSQQPDDLPDRYESGTPNTSGLAGLRAAATYILDHGIEAIRSHELRLTAHLYNELSKINGVKLFGPPPGLDRVGVISLTLAGWDMEEAAAALATEFGIACRAGLHCAPLAHHVQGTVQSGTLRLSLGAFSDKTDIDAAIKALQFLAESPCE